MQIEFLPANREQQLDLIRAYTLSVGLVDTYWLDQIYDGSLYEIRIDFRRMGLCAMKEREDALTGFYLKQEAAPYAMRVFAELRERLSPSLAYVVTNDETFLGLALDVHRRVEVHGYFFRDSARSPAPAKFPLERIRPAMEADLPDLIRTEFYHPARVEDPQNQIYVLRDENGAFMGTGHIALWMRLGGRDWGAVGMYTVPAFRGRGVGRSLILAMKELTIRQGLVPIAGCYHDNLASKATLESCGFVPAARYLKIFWQGF